MSEVKYEFTYHGPFRSSDLDGMEMKVRLGWRYVVVFIPYESFYSGDFKDYKVKLEEAKQKLIEGSKDGKS